MKNKIKVVFFLFVSLGINVANANNCIDLINFSKITNMIVEDKDSLETYAKNFCKEYNEGRSEGKSANFGLSYKVLSASLGGSSVSTKTVASKFCSAEDSRKAKKYAYKNYVETIAPGAFPAYLKCEEMKKKNLRFSIDQASILPREFSLAVKFLSTHGEATAKMSYIASNGVKCNWIDNDKAPKLVLKNGTSTLFLCKRDSANKKSFVKIIQTNNGGENITLTLPWLRYDSDGYKVDNLQNLEEKIAKTEESLKKYFSETLQKVNALENKITGVDKKYNRGVSFLEEGQKVCVVASAGTWHNVILVSKQWTSALCNNIKSHFGGDSYYLGCAFPTGLLTGVINSGTGPSRNCGW